MAAQSVEANVFGKKVVAQLTASHTQEIQKLVLWIEAITEVAGIAASSPEHQPSDDAINNALWAAREMAGRITEVVNSARPGPGKK